MNQHPFRILALLTFFYPHRGGSQKYAEDLYVGLLEHNPSTEIDVLCYNTCKQPHEEYYRGLHIYRVACFTIIPDRFVLPNPITLMRTLWKLRTRKYNIVNPHVQFFDVSWWGWIYAKLINAKSICTVHTDHAKHQSKFIQLVARFIDETIVRASLKRYDHITVENEHTQRFIINKYHVVNTTVVRGTIDTRQFSHENRTTLVKIPGTDILVGPNTQIVSYIGRLLWTKGVLYAYEAFRELAYSRGDVLFVIAGPGELYEQLASKIMRDGLSQKVLLTGNLNYAEVQQLLRITDIFTLPTHHNEGIPIILLEAGASKCTVITTSVGGIAEIIDDQSGYIIKTHDPRMLKDTIEYALNHPEERKTLANNLQQKIKNKHDISIVSEEFSRVVESIVSK
ncbi:glycosyltransferase family 4 protein [candidate division WWE3 bacterium]|nr:glycosyltransferase family 4 protein [candidate division WWE3 bacterium]